MHRFVIQPSSSSSNSPVSFDHRGFNTPPRNIPQTIPFTPRENAPYQNEEKKQHYSSQHHKRSEPYVGSRSHYRTIVKEQDEEDDENTREKDTLFSSSDLTHERKEPLLIVPKKKEEEEEEDPIKRMWNIYYDSMTLGQTWENLVIFYKDKMWEFDERRLKEYNLSEIRDIKIARTAVIRLLRKLSEDNEISEDAEIITTSSIIDECVPFEKICKRQILSVL